MSAPSNDTRTSRRPRVLWVGRMQFAEHLRVRETELARELTRHADIFALDRSDAMPFAPQGWRGKLGMRIGLWRSATRVLEEGPITRFRMRVAGATGPVCNRVAARFNNRKLAAAVKRFECSHVFLSSPLFFLPQPPSRRGYRVHFDLVDNFYDEWPAGIVGDSRRRFAADIMRNADTLSASSHSLCEHAQLVAGRVAAYAPNGAPHERFRNVSHADAERVRETLGLEGRFVVGFIGNHHMPFDGMATLLDALQQARRTRPDLALMIVGPGADRLAGPAGLGRDEGVWAVGPVAPDDVPAYFMACDAGVHPYDMRPLTHDATPLNVIEFSVCGKPMLCNPLRELQRLALPNLRFTPDGSVQAWARALADPATFADFDSSALGVAVAAFDWCRSASVLRAEMGL